MCSEDNCGSGQELTLVMDVPPKSGGPFSVLLLRSPFLREERVCTCLHSRSRLGNGGGGPARTQGAAASPGRSASVGF